MSNMNGQVLILFSQISTLKYFDNPLQDVNFSPYTAHNLSQNKM